jgi:hypothetical protein
MFEDKLDYVKMFDKVVPEDFYLTPKRFWYCEYDEKQISKEELEYDLRDLPNHIRVCKDNIEAREFLLEFTDQRKFKETEKGKFEIRWERKWMEWVKEWEIIPAKYLTIN